MKFDDLVTELLENTKPVLTDFVLNEKVINGILMCSKDCCGSPVMDCVCGDDCPHCNCFMIQKAVNEGKLKDKRLVSKKDDKEEDNEKKSDKVKIYRGKDYKVKVEKGKKFTKNGIYMKVYYQNPSLSKERHKQIANQIHRAISDEERPEEDAEYRGRKVTLNKPTRGDVKKFKVYVKDPKTGNVKKVNFGHGGTSAKRKGEKTMKIRKSNPKARKSFRARHNCDNPGPKTKARY